MTTLANKKLAVLIDADNAPADIIDRLLEEIAKYGLKVQKQLLKLLAVQLRNN